MEIRVAGVVEIGNLRELVEIVRPTLEHNLRHAGPYRWHEYEDSGDWGARSEVLVLRSSRYRGTGLSAPSSAPAP